MTLKEDKKEKSLPEHIRRIVNLIPNGSKRPITVHELTKLTGFSSTAVRKYVSVAVVSHQIPIGAKNEIGHSGYFIIETEKEKEQAIHNLSSRMREMGKRVKALKTIPDPKQGKLF